MRFLRFLPINQQLRALIVSLGLFLAASYAHAEKPVDPQASPNEFVQTVADNALEALHDAPSAKKGDLATINALVDRYVLPYVNFEKTTRLAAGRHWRQASEQQQKDLAEAFKGTLIRTYSGALSKVDESSKITVLPFRGDPEAADVVVRSSISQSNSPAIDVDYRLEKTPEGWQIYDLNVEGIWLIQNYRNQFTQQINQNGIDGLINALNQKNQ